jgi:arylsulfatase
MKQLLVVWRFVVERSTVSSLFIMVFFIAIFSNCERTATEGRRQVVLITIDTLRADHLGCYGYSGSTSPQIDAFAKKSVLFRDASSQAPWTTGSFASLMTGRVCSEALANSDQMNPDLASVAELLRDQGFTTVAVVANPELNSARGFSRGFDRYVELFLPTGGRSDEIVGKRKRESKVDAREVTDAVLRLLPQLADRDFFLWVLYMDPHTPYMRHHERFYPRDWPTALEGVAVGQPVDQRLISLPAQNGPDQDESSRSQIERKIQKLIFPLYDAEIRYVDQEVGRLLEGLDEAGISKRSLTIVTADHGENIYDHKHSFGHGTYPFEATVRVPLIMRWPGVSPGVVDGPVALVDLMPTVMKFAGVIAPEGLRGTALIPFELASHPPILVKTRGLRGPRAFREGPFKLISWRNGRFSLFNVIDDPGEKWDISAVDSVRCQILEERLSQYLLTLKKAPTDLPAPELSPQVKEQMRALGYIQ